MTESSGVTEVLAHLRFALALDATRLSGVLIYLPKVFRVFLLVERALEGAMENDFDPIGAHQ